uniref:Putative secreted protein n=1 Tax=Amblyomma triste TaxID=251400 RepID=A0A023G443_AMBTT
MKLTVLSLCFLSAFVFIADAQPQNDPKKLSLWIKYHNSKNKHLHCKPWCGLREKLGQSCGSRDCICVENAPGKPRLPLSCIWSPASGIRQYQALQKFRGRTNLTQRY